LSGAPGSRRWPWLLPALGYAALIFYLSSQANPLPFLPTSFFTHDKLLHATEYAGFSAVLAWGLDRVSGLGLRGAAMVAGAAASAYGLTDELHQAFVPGRSADVFDWIADTTGALAGALLAFAVLRWWRSRANLRA
jgi:VanZ family protein